MTPDQEIVLDDYDAIYSVLGLSFVKGTRAADHGPDRRQLAGTLALAVATTRAAVPEVTPPPQVVNPDNPKLWNAAQRAAVNFVAECDPHDWYSARAKATSKALTNRLLELLEEQGLTIVAHPGSGERNGR